MDVQLTKEELIESIIDLEPSYEMIEDLLKEKLGEYDGYIEKWSWVSKDNPIWDVYPDYMLKKIYEKLVYGKRIGRLDLLYRIVAKTPPLEMVGELEKLDLGSYSGSYDRWTWASVEDPVWNRYPSHMILKIYNRLYGK